MSVTDTEEDPWCIIDGELDIQQTIHFHADFSLEVKSTSSLSYTIMLSMLPELYRTYAGSEALRDTFFLTLMRSLNSVGRGRRQNGLYLWNFSNSQNISVNYRVPPNYIPPKSKCQIRLNKMLGPVNLNIDFRCELSPLEQPGIGMNEFLSEPKYIKKRKIIEMGRLLHMDLVRIKHQWYI